MSDATSIFKEADALRAYFMERGWTIQMEDNGRAVIDPFAAIIEAGRSSDPEPAPPLDARTNRYESALNRIAGLGMDAPAFGPEPGDFYRDQLMTAIGTAARALKDGAVPALQATPDRYPLNDAEGKPICHCGKGRPAHWSTCGGVVCETTGKTLREAEAALQATGEGPHE